MDANQTHPNPTWLVIFTWAVVLLVSDLPDSIWQALMGDRPAWLFWPKVALLLLLLLASLVWKWIRPIRLFILLLLVLMLASWGMNWLRTTPAYLHWEQQAGWLWGMVAYQAIKLAVTCITILALLLLGRRRKEFFLTRGQLNAPVRPAKPGVDRGKRSLTWGQLGLILGLCILPLTVLFFTMGNLPSSAALIKALPFLPVVLLFAATNAFSEETQFRASLLGDLRQAFGDDHAIWMTAAFFGFMHYFGGSPAGIPGVIIAGLLGALFATCMLGSKGLTVPWFIHFCQNAVIYSFWAIDSVI